MSFRIVRSRRSIAPICLLTSCELRVVALEARIDVAIYIDAIKMEQESLDGPRRSHDQAEGCATRGMPVVQARMREEAIQQALHPILEESRGEYSHRYGRDDDQRP